MKRVTCDYSNVDGMIALLIFEKGIDPDTAYTMAEGKPIRLIDIAKQADFYKLNNISIGDLAKMLGVNKLSLRTAFYRKGKKKR